MGSKKVEIYKELSMAFKGHGVFCSAWVPNGHPHRHYKRHPQNITQSTSCIRMSWEGEGERERERERFFGITLTAKWSRLSEKIWQVRPFPVVLLHLSCVILKNHVHRPLCFTKIYTAPKLIWHCFKNKAKASQNIRDIRKLTLNV